MLTDADKILRDIEAIRARNPVVLSITNYVVTNTTANALLAIGASPIMSHAVEEMAELVAISGALVVNLGTVAPEYLAAMDPAWAAADEAGVPVVLDPVGAGASLLRTVTPLALLAKHKAPPGPTTRRARRAPWPPAWTARWWSAARRTSSARAWRARGYWAAAPSCRASRAWAARPRPCAGPLRR
ncbi:MAG: hydroxyethylthiazole [Desulfovibrionaceae bacterium]|nr:MAG: hydroxyethylthiazole [Desulfovibrionaceae bacterium]